MRKISILLILVVVFTSSCDYLRKKGILANKEYIERLENTLKDDSIENAAMLEKIKLEAQQKIDSITNACGKCTGNYHIITGSFRNQLNADNYQKEMSKLGYKSAIVEASNGFHLVSAYCGSDYKEVLNALSNIRNSVNQESWLYVQN